MSPRRLLALACNAVAYAAIAAMAPNDPEYQVAWTTLLIVGLGAGLSAAGSAYSGNQQANAQEAQLDFLRSPAGMLGPLGMIFGGDNLAALKDSVNQLLEEEGLSFLGSPEQQNVGAFYAKLKPEEKAFLDAIKSHAAQPPTFETAASDFLGSLLAGEFLPGQARQNPLLGPVLDSIRLNAREAAGFAGEQFRSDASRVLGGLSGAASFLPVYGDQVRDFQTRETDLVNQTFYNAYNDTFGSMVRGLGLAPAVQTLPFTRLQLGRQAAAVPRELRDIGIQRALTAFENRANRYANLVGGFTGQIAGNPYPGVMASIPFPSNAYIGDAVADLGNSLALVGMLGLGGDRGGGGGGVGTSTGYGPALTNFSGFLGSPALNLDVGSPSIYTNPFSSVAPSSFGASPLVSAPFGGTTRRYPY